MPSRLTIARNSASTITVDFKNDDGTALDLTNLAASFQVPSLSVNVSGVVASPTTGRAVFTVPAQAGVDDNALYDAQLSITGSAPVEVVAVGQADGTSSSTPATIVVVQNSAAVVAGIGVSREVARVDAYVGEIEDAAAKNYHVDNALVVARELTSVNVQAGSGTATVSVVVQRGNTLLVVCQIAASSTASSVSGTGLQNTSLQAGDKLLFTVKATPTPTAENLRFVIGYSQ